MIFGQNLGRQTEKAKQGILRYIWDRKLREGDKIPSQTELCRHLQIGCATLDRAVKALVQDGVLEARRRVGVFVRNAKPEGLPGRSIGIVGLLLDAPHMFNWSLAYAVQDALQKNGCECTMFPFREEYRDTPEFSDFPGLEYAVSQKLVHGLISISDFYAERLLPGLDEAGLKVCFCGPPSHVESGIFLDSVGFMIRGLDELREAGYRTPRILIGPGPLRHFSLPRLAEYLAGWPECTVPLDAMYLEGYGLESGRRLAQIFLQMPPERRPDSVVIGDDIIAQGFFSELVRKQGRRIDYLPPAVCLRNRKAPIDFPCREVIDYEIDSRELAEGAVEQLLNRLRGAESVPSLRWIPPLRLTTESVQLKPAANRD